MGFYPGDPNNWSKEDDDHLHNFDPKDRKVSFSFFRPGMTYPGEPTVVNQSENP